MNPDQLNGWKEISAYVGKGVRQAQRWEKLGMPVHRVGGMDGVVFAFRSEIDQWRASSEGADAHGETAPDANADSAPEPRGLSLPLPALWNGAPRVWLRWMLLAGLILPLGIVFGYAYVFRAPLAIDLQSPDAAPQGGSFRFVASGGDAGLQQAYRVFRNPRGGELLVSPPVPRGSDGRFVWVYSTDCLTPLGPHEVFLADSSGTALTAPVRVEVKEHASCSGPVPDLQTDSIVLTETEVAAGDTVKCLFVLRNQGARSAYPSMTRLRLSQSPLRSSVTDIRLADVPAPLLAPGEEMSFELDVRVPADTLPGIYYIWAVADNNSDNVEALTHNNYVKSIPLAVLAR